MKKSLIIATILTQAISTHATTVENIKTEAYIPSEPILQIKEDTALDISVTWPSSARNRDMAKELIANALLKEEIAIDISHLDLNTEDANAYFRELLANDKRLFHVLKGWMYPKVDDDKVLTTIYPNYDRHLVDNYDYYYNLLDTEIDKVVALASEGKTDLEKILIINDYLATNFEYDTLGLKSDTEIRDKVRFIEERRGVCESYADFAKLVLNELGIPNITVSSIRLNHIWNMGSKHFFIF